MSLTSGRVCWVFEDHFDVDMIVGVKNAGETDIQKLVDVCMKDYDSEFIRKIKAGDILIGGRNFGYGHPHPQAMRAMRHLGIKTVIAKSFFRGFFKNEISAGMVLLPCLDLPNTINVGDELFFDTDEWIIKIHNETLRLNLVPEVEKDIIRSGGIAPYLKNSLRI
jgi:3-isopropylmalate/(R)-2-methylmalate dehydratase small subunit